MGEKEVYGSRSTCAVDNGFRVKRTLDIAVDVDSPNWRYVLTSVTENGVYFCALASRRRRQVSL